MKNFHIIIGIFIIATCLTLVAIWTGLTEILGTALVLGIFAFVYWGIAFCSEHLKTVVFQLPKPKPPKYTKTDVDAAFEAGYNAAKKEIKKEIKNAN